MGALIAFLELNNGCILLIYVFFFIDIFSVAKLRKGVTANGLRLLLIFIYFFNSVAMIAIFFCSSTFMFSCYQSDAVSGINGTIITYGQVHLTFQQCSFKCAWIFYIKKIMFVCFYAFWLVLYYLMSLLLFYSHYNWQTFWITDWSREDIQHGGMLWLIPPTPKYNLR